MTSSSSRPINLHERNTDFTVEDRQTILALVDQLNVVTARLHALEEQLTSGTVVPSVPVSAPKERPERSLRSVRTEPTSGWQPA